MTRHFDWVVVGGGPAGQKAAVQASKAGQTVAMIEKGRRIGGECVHRGTIPSKALRETALSMAKTRSQATALRASSLESLSLHTLIGRVDQVVDAHVAFQEDQISRNGIELVHGLARFVDARHLQVQRPGGDTMALTADRFVVATGSIPWTPPGLDVDHEFVLDSDSILSQPYLPDSLLVIGGGVIACEYATVFKQLGCNVMMVDRGERPLSFLDRDLSDAMLASFVGDGCRYLPRNEVRSIERTTISVRAKLRNGEVLTAEKALVAAGRTAHLAPLGLIDLGVETTQRGHVKVDAEYRSSIPHILAVGDVIGFPGLASTSMEQGRRAVRLALGLPVTDADIAFPLGIYSIPEFASVGLTEAQALEAHGEIRVGTCNYDEVARGQISGTRGMLKLLSTPDRSRLLGVHVAGNSATEIVHLGHMALIGRMPPSVFVDYTFNFPTLAEAYRIAALALERPTALRTREVVPA